MLAVEGEAGQSPIADYDADEALPGGWWDLERGVVPGGVNQAGDAEEEEDR